MITDSVSHTESVITDYTIMANSRQKVIQSRDYTLLLPNDPTVLHDTLQAYHIQHFEQFGALYMQNLNDIRPGGGKTVNIRRWGNAGLVLA